MHIIESAALTCGSKIDKPFIYQTFFPLPYEKFIIFFSQNKIPSKDYWYFQDVFNYIFPRLEKEGIKILQIGTQDSIFYNGVVNLCGRLSISQTAYLIDKALLFLGTDGFESQIAGVSNIPLVCMNSSTYANNTGPFFGDKNKQIIFESFLRTGNKKPSFNVNEIPRSINLIKPEEIANSVFKLLDIKYIVPFETIFVGEKYSHFTIQEVMIDSGKQMFAPDNIVEIRADIDFKDQELAQILNHYKKTVIVTNKIINLELLKVFKANIQGLIYKITKDNTNLEFLNVVRELGIKIILMSDLSQDEIDALKIYYYEYGPIHKFKQYSEDIIKELKKDGIDKLFYRSSKITSASERLFYSHAAQEKGIFLENNFEYQKIIDSPLFWENLDFFCIVKLIN